MTSSKNGYINYYTIDEKLDNVISSAEIGLDEFDNYEVMSSPVITNEILQNSITTALWTIFDSTLGKERIVIWLIGENYEFNKSLNDTLNLENGKNPSVASDLGFFFIGYVAPFSIVLPSFNYNGDLEYLSLKKDTVKTKEEYVDIHIDNPIGPIGTYALVYEDSNKIYYIQTEYYYYTPIVPKQICNDTDSNILKYKPNVCYRQFRKGYFDIVWTEGNDIPYKIKFQRIPKSLHHGKSILSFSNYHLEKGVYFEKKIITNPFFYLKYESGLLPEGLAYDSLTNTVKGIPLNGGTYKYTLYFNDMNMGGTYKRYKTFTFNISGDSTGIHQFSTYDNSLNLFQNYPNPFNPSTKIIYQIDQPSHVSLKIFNITGQEISTLVNDYQNTGFYSYYWMPKNLKSGIYICRLKVNNQVKVRKLIYQK